MYQSQTNNSSNQNEEFSNQKNKALLWNLMYEGGVFKGISSQYLENVKNEFERKIVKITSNMSSSATLTQLNKQIISEMMTDLNKYRVINNTAPASAPASASTITTPLKEVTVEPVTAKEVSEKKLKQFNNNLEKKQSEFDEFLKQKQPDEIDFSDKLDQPIGNEINNMLEAAISKRENELNIVLDKQNAKEAEKWINKDNDNKEKQVRFEPIQLKAPTQPHSQPHSQPQPKSQQPSVDSFLSKLKPKKEEDNNIKNEITKINERLTLIETSQGEILELLNKIISNNDNK